jgi:hypothetical protein
VSGIGFGSTDVDAATMEQFVSAQTFALRASSPARFGFAVVPRSASPTDAVAVEDRLAAALQGSDGNAAGACGSDRSSCAGSVAGAQFTAAWQVFANTREGRRVTVIAGNGTRVTFAAVAGRGVTYATIGAVQLPLPPALRRRPGSLAYTIATTAAHTGAVTVCLPIDPAAYRVYAATLGRLGNRGWAPVRSLRGGTRVCGGAPTLGTFAVFARSKHAR